MITSKMADVLNKHMNSELYSSYLYLSMSAYASSKGLAGAASWCYVQAKEELLHVEKLHGYFDVHGARVILEAIEKPPADFGSLLNIFEAVLAHEKKVTALVNETMAVATGESDHATETFLQWFVTEQTEEEKSVNDIIDKLKLGGETGPAAFMIDRELAARVLTVPTP